LGHSLIDRGANPNAENAIKETPLFPASRNGYIEVVDEILSRRVDVDHPNSEKREKRWPLHEELENRHNFVAELLLQHQADPNARDKCADWFSLDSITHGIAKGTC